LKKVPVSGQTTSFPSKSFLPKGRVCRCQERGATGRAGTGNRSNAGILYLQIKRLENFSGINQGQRAAPADIVGRSFGKETLAGNSPKAKSKQLVKEQGPLIIRKKKAQCKDKDASQRPSVERIMNSGSPDGPARSDEWGGERKKGSLRPGGRISFAGGCPARKHRYDHIRSLGENVEIAGLAPQFLQFSLYMLAGFQFRLAAFDSPKNRRGGQPKPILKELNCPGTSLQTRGCPWLRSSAK